MSRWGDMAIRNYHCPSSRYIWRWISRKPFGSKGPPV